jgi:hypothetical protein
MTVVSIELQLGGNRPQFLCYAEIRELALARNLPCCGYVKEVLDAGALISCGADQRLIAAPPIMSTASLKAKSSGHAGRAADPVPALH